NKLQREAFASTLGFASTPLSPEIEQYNLQSGERWRALQNLGIQYPGTGRSVPVFKPDIPGVQKGELISGTSGHPGPAQPIQKGQVAGQASNIGLTTVRGTEFGEIDNPARGGYTEAGWNTGAWGANIADKSNPMVALPYSVLNNYGNPRDKDFGSNFNSKYEVHVVDPNTGKVVVASLGDAGPGAKTGAGLDMTWGTREKLGLPVGFSGNISYRVVPKGTAAPEGTTASVQQTAQQAQNADLASGGFAPGSAPSEVYIRPLDTKGIRDPSIHGTVMPNDERLRWARMRADEFAGQMDDAGAPLSVKEYKQKFAEYAD